MSTAVTDLASTALKLQKTASTQRSEAEIRAADASVELERAERAARAAARAAQIAGITNGREFTTLLHGLTEEVRVARQSAEAAVRDGGDALAAWVEYRRLRAENQGKWRILGGKYTEVTGNEPPPGAWGPEIHDPSRPGAIEPFQTFVTNVVLALELAERERSTYDMQNALFDNDD
ncbi:hypothetical protein GCM10009745_24450 [Kribbella yunnanensis]|uniref:Uncharacterized protein n=1 Tax=Kribbella yunnanensis TaxID=190194 RepID=A0ABN2H008_9ACTN